MIKSASKITLCVYKVLFSKFQSQTQREKSVSLGIKKPRILKINNAICKLNHTITKIKFLTD